MKLCWLGAFYSFTGDIFFVIGLKNQRARRL